MSVTIKQVASEAGVSIATVSRVLNDKGPISEATRRRVEEVVARLHYVPHCAARSLITNRTNAIGVVLPDIHGEFFSEVIRGMDRTAWGNGYHLLVSSSHADRSGLEEVLRAIFGRVDGLILMTPDVDGDTLRAFVPTRVPVVLLNCHDPGGAFDSIGVDNVGGARAMTRHLIARGHRRIAIVTGPAGNTDARERLRGFREELATDDGPAVAGVELAGDFGEASGFDAGRRLLHLTPRPSAVFAANDSMAIGVLAALQEAGVRVPEEVAVAGFDDIPIARFIAPPLSSVSVDIAALGARAAERVLGMLARGIDAQGVQETLATSLVIRRSCGGPLDAGIATSAAEISAVRKANSRQGAGRGPTGLRRRAT